MSTTLFPTHAPDVDTDANAIILSGDMLVEVDANGEVVGVHGAPDGASDIEDIIAYLGPRKLAVEAKIESLRAEKAAYIAKIDSLFDPQIKQQEGTLNWLLRQYYSALEAYARNVIPNLKRGKSFTSGLLSFSLKKIPAKTEIRDKDRALAWAEKHCPEAIKVKREVQVSLIPSEIKATLTPDQAEETGVVFNPGGDDEFKLS